MLLDILYIMVNYKERIKKKKKKKKKVSQMNHFPR